LAATVVSYEGSSIREGSTYLSTTAQAEPPHEREIPLLLTFGDGSLLWNADGSAVGPGRAQTTSMMQHVWKFDWLLVV
jgi:hypothetical protein